MFYAQYTVSTVAVFLCLCSLYNTFSTIKSVAHHRSQSLKSVAVCGVFQLLYKLEKGSTNRRTKAPNESHYGKCRIQCLRRWIHIIQDTSASTESILALSFKISVS